MPIAASNRAAEEHLEIQSRSATGVSGVSEFAEFSVGTREVRISLQKLKYRPVKCHKHKVAGMEIRMAESIIVAMKRVTNVERRVGR